MQVADRIFYRISVAASLALALHVAVAQAQTPTPTPPALLTFVYEGTVDDTFGFPDSGPFDAFLGEAIRVEYTFNTTTPDSNGSSNGDYVSAVTEAELTVGSNVYTATGGNIIINNNGVNPDQYIVEALVGLAGPNVGGISPYRIQVRLTDNTQTFFGSDALPIVQPDPSGFSSVILQLDFCSQMPVCGDSSGTIMARNAAIGTIATPTATPSATPTPTPTPGLKMYEGSLILHFFGNDVTTGSSPFSNAYIFTALPLGAKCNPAMPGGKTCTPATLQKGAPLTGSGSALVGGGSPASIMLPASQLGRITSGSMPQRYANQIYQKTYANLANAAGSFQAGGGPGSITYSITPAFAVTIVPTPGKNQFGGVMRLLKGTPSFGLGTKAKYTLYPSFVYDFPTWGATLFGATSIGGNPASVVVTGTIDHTTLPSLTFSYTAMVRGWPWTTGKVRVLANGDFLGCPDRCFPEILSRTGYDNRTSQGGGTIQLVTPHLIQWQGALKLGAIGVLRLKFVPEPSSGLVLLAGSGLLSALYRRRNR